MALLRRGAVAWTSLTCNAGKFGGGVVSMRHSAKVPGREEAVVITDDGKTIVCWHPEPQVPYELSMPLPEGLPESDSILKVQDNEAMKKLFRQQHPFFIRKELQELTFTTKHKWFPQSQKRFAKKNPPRDREYL